MFLEPCEPGQCFFGRAINATVMGFSMTDLFKIQTFLRARNLTVDNLRSYYFMPRPRPLDASED